MELRKFLFAGISILGLFSLDSQAKAMTSPQPTAVDLGPLGSVNLSGGISGLAWWQSGTSNNSNPEASALGDQSVGANIENAYLNINKASGLIQYTVQLAAFGGDTLGAVQNRASFKETPLLPLLAGYLTLAPSGSPLSFNFGEMISVEGYEGAYDFTNANIYASAAWYEEAFTNLAASTTYTKGPLTLLVMYGDGFNTKTFNVVQTAVTYNFNASNYAYLWFVGNLGQTGVNTRAIGTCGDTTCTTGQLGSYFVNSQQYGGAYSWTFQNLNLVAEVQYTFAKQDHRVEVPQFTSALAIPVIADYTIANTPYSIGGMAEYFTSNGPGDWFVAPHASGVGFEVTPTWQGKYLFARISVGVLHLTNATAYGNNGLGRNVIQTAIETGITF